MSQVREHLTFGIRNHVRSFLQRLRIGFLGQRVFIDGGVSLMRFPRNIHINDDVILKAGARICACNDAARISIGARTTIGYNSLIFASSSITIGDDCLIAPFAYLVDSNHGIKLNKLINQQENSSKPIVIGNDVWIANGVTILQGVNIGEGAVVAANSVVNCDIPAYEIWGGSPAKMIGVRSE